MKKIMIIMFFFMPTVSAHTDTKHITDTDILLNQISGLNDEKEIILDSLTSLRESMITNDTFVESYNVDAVSGKRVTWNFLYRIKYDKYIKDFDTLFLCVKKEKSNWKN